MFDPTKTDTKTSLISRRELIAAAVAAGAAAIPVDCDANSRLPAIDNIVFITVERHLSEAQLKQFTDQIWGFLKRNGSKLIPCVLHNGAKIQFYQPYTIHEKIGDYEHSIGCQTKAELAELSRGFYFGESE